jgi:hypothetical protein
LFIYFLKLISDDSTINQNLILSDAGHVAFLEKNGYRRLCFFVAAQFGQYHLPLGSVSSPIQSQ